MFFTFATLGACAPIQQVTPNVIDSTFGDEATLSFIQGGVAFDPGGKPALGAIVVLQGQGLKTLDVNSPCKSNPSNTELDCALGDVTAVQTLKLSGKDVTASVSYRRAGSNRVYLEVAK
ncbi:hypothetical protein [Deinococcus misasensis]|uniref:hypothetical protein n=1 Tax=Deinococcus misasensis TaxID=392413 RepID=UPI000A7766A1|nr:hypothetical protein [Deinococcus misasensis]